MADEPTGQTAEAPADAAPASAFDEARATLRAAETTDSPAPSALDSKKPNEERADDEAQAPEAEDDESEPKGSRRQRNRALEEQIEKRVREKIEAEQAESRTKEDTERQAREERESLLTTIREAQEGKYEAVVKLAGLAEDKLVHAPETQRREGSIYLAGRQAMISELAADFASIKGQLDGVDDEGYKALSDAPSVAEYGKRAWELGRKSREGDVARLEARIESLTGKLAGRSPSPIGASGQASNGSHTNLTGIRGAYEEAKAELGWRG